MRHRQHREYPKGPRTVSKGGKLGEALVYGLNHWAGLSRYLDDGRTEIDSNTVERGMRGVAVLGHAGRRRGVRASLQFD